MNEEELTPIEQLEFTAKILDFSHSRKTALLGTPKTGVTMECEEAKMSLQIVLRNKKNEDMFVSIPVELGPKFAALVGKFLSEMLEDEAAKRDPKV